MTVPFGTDISRDLLVGIQSILIDDPTTSFLSVPILSFIDAGVPHMWLPQASCDAFAKAFSLTYNSTLDLYLVNATAHTALLKQNPTFTFTISSDITSSSPNTTTITFPYSAFDLELTTDYPGVSNTTRYFPIRRAANYTQYTLGRAFLQQAYLIADYERSTFSVHQALFDAAPEDLVTIPSLATAAAAASQSSPLSAGAIAGIVVAAVVVLTGLCACVFFVRRRRRRRNGRGSSPRSANSKTELNELHGEEHPHHTMVRDGPREADSKPVLYGAELEGPVNEKDKLAAMELTGEGRRMAELEGWEARGELDGGWAGELEGGRGGERGPVYELHG